MQRSARASLRLLSCGGLLLAVTAAARADDQPPPLDKPAVELIAKRYRAARGWGGRAAALQALGPRWHPAASGLLGEALSGRDRRLRAFALEALAATRRGWLAPAATPLLIDGLVAQLDEAHPLIKRRALEQLRRLAPFVAGESAETMRAWWRESRAGWRQAPVPAAVREPSGSVEVAFRRTARIAELDERGLDLMICIDSSASMKRAIRSTRQAATILAELLVAVSPDARVGLLHYKDVDTLAGGAELLIPLTDRLEAIAGRLGKLRSKGGGDRLEAVDIAIQLAYQRDKVGWREKTLKVALLIGDAPCKPEKREALYNLVRQMRYDKRQLGIELSTVDTSRDAKDTAEVFGLLADNGGGLYTRLPPGSAEDVKSALELPLLDHMLRLCFGKRDRAQADRWLATYRRYARAGKLRTP